MFSHAEMSFIGIVGWLLVIILICIRIAVHGLINVILHQENPTLYFGHSEHSGKVPRVPRVTKVVYHSVSTEHLLSELRVNSQSQHTTFRGGHSLS